MKQSGVMLLLLGLVGWPATAEVYRWTDADGKVHYGDKNPAQASENITRQVKTTNLDTSQAEQQKLQALFNKETEAARQQQQQLQANAEQARTCANARRYQRVANGRVMYVDSNGKPIHVSEEARKASEQAARQFVQENCSNP